MRGGILLACHHGLTQPQIDYMHEKVTEFLRPHMAGLSRAAS